MILNKQALTFVMALCAPLLCKAQEWSTLLQEFEQYAEQSRELCKAVGMAIAIVKDGKVVYIKGFGNKNLGENSPVNPDTLFQIGSMSKSFTTALTAVAVDQNLLNWKDSVIDHFPDFQVYDPWVTRAFQIEDLYSQRSGLIAYAGDAQAILGFPIDQIMHNIRYFKPITSFRSTFAYLNVFFSFGAQIVSEAMGKTWGTLIREKFFQPLNMKNSSSDLKSYLNNPNRVGWHFRSPDGVIHRIPDDADTASWVYTYAPAGGINSNVVDMAKWLIMQADGGVYQGRQIVSKENLTRTYRRNVYAGEFHWASTYYCMGWLSQDYSPYPIIWHNGGTSGVNNNMAIIPQERLGIVILCNTRDTVLAEALTYKFIDMYYNKPKIDWTQKMLTLQKQQEDSNKPEEISEVLPSLPLSDYAGTYSNPIYGDIVINVNGEDLQIEIGPRKTQWNLKHYNRDAFSLWWPPLEEGDSKVSFCLDAQNRPEKVIIDYLQEDGEGTFDRVVEDSP